MSLNNLTGHFEVVDDRASNFTLKFTLNNPNDVPLHVSEYHTPFETPMLGPVLSICKTGLSKDLKFLGPMCKRSPPSFANNNFFTLEAHGSHSGEVKHISKCYAIESNGTYNVTLNRTEMEYKLVKSDSEPSHFAKVNTNTVTVTLK
eukprot:TRINITY_DN2299_c0_g2_i1.p1 TRINITY_DN2299_c0_g2~~TRINITY_DN2299_c0_g2_i1.p1  ORF type:complete len:147 (-),score=23.43 TRINITY_DN2299_c0_g2_i1:31-471(-)